MTAIRSKMNMENSDSWFEWDGVEYVRKHFIPPTGYVLVDSWWEWDGVDYIRKHYTVKINE